MAAIPNRIWKTICEQAHALGLHRSFKAKGDAIRAGKSHAQRVAIRTAYEKMNIIAQVGKDCEVTLGDVTHTIKLCNATKLANTILDKEGEQYTVEEMDKWGFKLK